MGILDSLGSVGKLLDVGSMVKDVVDKMLPQNMQFVGDMAGAIVDFKSGNVAGAAKLGMEALKDLPQAAKGQAQQPQGATSNASGTSRSAAANSTLDPSPPPRARDANSFDWNDLLSAIKALTTALSGQGAAAATATAAKPGDGAATSAPAAAPGTTTAPSATDAAPSTAATRSTAAAPAAPTTTAAATTAATAPAAHTGPKSPADYIEQYRSTHGGWSGTAQAAAPANSAQTAWQGRPMTPAPTAATHASASATSAADAAPATSTPAAAPAASAAPAPAADHPAAATTPAPAETKPAKNTSSQKAAADKGQTISSISQLQGMSDAAIRDAVINGRISPDFAKDPAGMMALQQRMNAITEMNNLMTAMMRAIHDMQMAVIQNIRI